jgi:hypothetical protein
LIWENVELKLMYLFILHWTCSVQQNWKIDHTVLYANSGYFVIEPFHLWLKFTAIYSRLAVGC